MPVELLKPGVLLDPVELLKPGGLLDPAEPGVATVSGDPRPVGFFDSGVGGLTVLREVLRRSPAESTIYLGDNDRTPYGPRPDDEVVRFSIFSPMPESKLL